MNTPPQKLELYQTINIDPNNQNLQRNDFDVLANAHNYLLAYTLDLEKRHEMALEFIAGIIESGVWQGSVENINLILKGDEK